MLKMIECVYKNDTSRMVIVKCIGADHFYREKVVMPIEVFWCEAPEDARLEIWKTVSYTHLTLPTICSV